MFLDLDCTASAHVSAHSVKVGVQALVRRPQLFEAETWRPFNTRGSHYNAMHEHDYGDAQTDSYALCFLLWSESGVVVSRLLSPCGFSAIESIEIAQIASLSNQREPGRQRIVVES